ncbi:MAG: sigma-70 family RNA polymerase sigma factor [Chloroflexi bacterium]|nr:MAG: sigma-70 family RNA polymerase sigma factor [Chloroflexota bacterium]
MAEPESQSEAQADDAEERDLVAASARGDQDAFRRLVERYRRLVLHVAFRSMGDMSLAEDVAQEAFIKVFRGLPHYRPEKPFVHWLHRVVANAVTDELRRKRATIPLDALVNPPESSEAEPEDVAGQHDVQQAVRAAIAALPPRYREIISLQVFHELTYEEIARRLRLPLGTVMWRLNMAKRLLRKQLGDAFRPAA